MHMFDLSHYFEKKPKQKVRKPSVYKKAILSDLFVPENKGYFDEILFLPFKLSWMVVMSLLIIATSITTLNVFILDNKLGYFGLPRHDTVSPYRFVLLVFTEILYLTDLFLLTLHKLSTKLRVTRPYLPISVVYLIVAYLTIVPSITSILYQWNSDIHTPVVFQLTVLLRLYRTIHIYHHLMNSTYINEYLVIYTFLPTLFLIISILAFQIIFIWLYFAQSSGKTAEEILLYMMPMQQNSIFDSWPLNSEGNLLLRAYYVAINFICGRGIVSLFPLKLTVALFCQIWMVIALAIRLSTIGIFASILVNKHRWNIEFNAIQEILKWKIQKMDVSKSSCLAIKRWYNTLWTARRGITDHSCLSVLPSGLLTDCALDVHITALKHSHLFRNIDNTFASALATKMKTLFHSEGDIIYGKKAVKEAMWYVHAGAVHIMSVYDDSTPIVTLYPGSTFGESTLIVSYPCYVTIACATYCELKILTKKSFVNVCKIFPKEFRSLQQEIKYRYEQAYLLKAMKMIDHRRNISDKVGIHPDGPLKRIKRIARAIDKTSFGKMYFKFDQQDKLNEIADNENLKSHYIGTCSDYLDSFAISQFVVEKDESTFVRTKCPVVLRTNSPFVKFWKIIIHFCVFYMVFSIPYEAGLGVSVSGYLHTVSAFIQLIFVLDLFVQCSFAVNTHDQVIGTAREILLYRLNNTLVYKADILGSLPINLFVLLTDRKVSWSTWGLLKLNYTLRAWRIFKLTSELIARSFYYRELTILLILLFYFVIFICYWSMIFSVLSCFDNECNPKAMWVQIESNTETRENMLRVSVRTVMRTLLLCLGEGCGIVVPYTFSEHLAHVVMTMLFFFLDAYMVGFMCAAAIHTRLVNYIGTDSISAIQNLQSKYHLPADLQYRIYRQIRLKQLLRNSDYYKGTENLHGLSDHLRRQIKLAGWVNYILQVPLFKNTEQVFLLEVVDLFSSQFFPANEIICYSGILTQYMYIIKQGYCEIVPSNADDVVVVKGPGWSFGVLEVVINIPLIKTIRTVTCCECLILAQSDLLNVFSKFPNYKKEIKRTKKRCDVLQSLPVVEGIESTILTKAEEDNSFYHFGYNLIVGSKAEMAFLKPFGRLTVLRFVLLRSMMLPTGNAIWALELTRSFFALITCYFFPAKIFFYYYSSLYRFFFLALDITAYIDMFLRLHVAYYNEKGILITHPLMTARHYIKTTFILDFFGSIPLEILLGHLISSPYTDYWLCFNRVIQLHRVIGLINYMQYSKISPSITIITIKYFIIITVSISFLTCVLLIRCCDVVQGLHVTTDATEWVGIQCPTLDYNVVMFGRRMDPYTAYVFYQLYVTVLMTQMNLHKFGWDAGSGVLKFFISLCGYIIITYMTSQISALTCLENTGLMYQQQVKQMMRFLHKYGVRKELKDEFSVYYNTLLEKYHGTNPKASLQIVNKTLQADVFFYIYGKYLKEHTVFAKSNLSFFRSLLILFYPKIFHKGSLILKEGFVHGDIYLLYEGFVTVRSGSRTVMTLNKGSFFGNLFDVVASQQSVNIVANTTVEVLVISTSRFHYILSSYPHYQILFVNALKKNCDRGTCIIPSLTNTLAEDDSEQVSYKVTQKTSTLRCKRLSEFKSITALVSSITTLYTIATFDFSILWLLINFLVDVLTKVLIILQCYTPYKDQLNEYEINLKKIRLYYRRQRYGFWFDLLTTFPLEVFWFCFNHRRVAYTLLRFNRIFRYLIFNAFLTNLQKRISSKQFTIRVMCLILNIYTLLFVLTSCYMFVFWYCQQHYKFQSLFIRLGQFLRLMTHILFDFVHHPRIKTFEVHHQLVISFRNVEMVVTVIAIAIIMGHVLFYVETFYYDMLNYLHTKDSITSLLKLDCLGKYLYKNVQSYLNFLWQFYRGSQQPQILSLAPKSLQQKLLKTIYDHHIASHYVFGKCQNKFSDQILLYLSREMILPGNIIVRQGTKDETMYFIHEGLVTVYSNSKGNQKEELVGLLSENEFFGTRQGLKKAIPHTYTYKAHSLVIVLKLVFNSWSHLLEHFPLENRRIYRILKRQSKEYKFDG